MIIDTHSHISFKAYDKDREEVIKRIKEAGVVCIDVGTKYETSKMAVELAEANKGVYAAIGMHPIHIKTDLIKLRMDEDEGDFAPLGEEYDKEKYRELVLEDRKKAEVLSLSKGEGLERSRKIVAIGEIGLDYYYKPKTTARLEQFKELQRKVFVEQLELAKELNLPVIVHCRMAHDEIIEILGEHKGLTGTIHCFTGSWEQAQKYVDLGFYLGINGIIFKFDIDEVIKQAPLDRLLVETDCPYLTPTVEGKDTRNEPIFVKHVIQRIADLRGVSFEEIADKTTENAKKLFKI
jgi:TatD DNase family protein